MAPLNIPERYRRGVASIRDLDDQTVQEIRNGLDRAFPVKVSDESETSGHDLNHLATSAIESSGKPEPIKSKQITDTVAALYQVKAMREISVEDFAEKVAEAMESLPQDDLRLPREHREQFKKKLTILMGAKGFAVQAKVVDLKTEHERVFCNARIFTDLRPVFDSELDSGPQGLIITHLLKLNYHSGSEKLHDFFVALDAEDLKKLKILIDRAEIKAKSMQTALPNVRLFGMGKE